MCRHRLGIKKKKKDLKTGQLTLSEPTLKPDGGVCVHCACMMEDPC